MQSDKLVFGQSQTMGFISFDSTVLIYFFEIIKCFKISWDSPLIVHFIVIYEIWGANTFLRILFLQTLYIHTIQFKFCIRRKPLSFPTPSSNFH
jgi:hypothetical protein